MERQPDAIQSLIPSDLITIFLTGDVMVGRGIDQILPHPGDPAIHESYLKVPGAMWNLPRGFRTDPAAC